MPMTHEQRTLWSKIAAFEIDDPGSDFRFSQRLARDNGWRPEYAEEVIDEYRRFVFLAFAAGHLLALLEAMKMEHRITAPADGVVKTILVHERDVVREGDVLVELG